MGFEILSIRPPESSSARIESLTRIGLDDIEAILWRELRCVLERLSSSPSEQETGSGRETVLSILETLPPGRSRRKEVLRQLRRWYETTAEPQQTAASSTHERVRCGRDRDRAFVLRNLLNDLIWLDESPEPTPLEVLFVPESPSRVLAVATYGTDVASSPGPDHPVPYVHNLWSRQPGLGRELLAAVRQRTGCEVIYLRPLNEGVRRYYRETFPSGDD